MEFRTIEFKEAEPGVGLITLNRPDRLNALNLDMVEELTALFDQLRRQEQVRVLVITGEGRGFCSGADLKDERVRRDADTLFSSAAVHLVAVQKKYSDLITGMRRLPQPIIAAVNGPAAGGGMCIALASDVVIAGPPATFIASFINIGLSGGELGTTYFLPRLVGSARAAEILFTGRTVDVTEAEKIGLVSRVVEEGSLMAVALDTARIMLSKSPMGLRLTKEALNQNLTAPSLEAAIELENRNQSICCVSPEFSRAVKAFGKGK
ncbi:MAG: enoyl-CoA hydratase/isomerase family protein [Desulfobacterales bacterium]|nr:enoyl-CoA hydratase/isomerase family protein [Desulfobacterales bacterium]